MNKYKTYFIFSILFLSFIAMFLVIIVQDVQSENQSFNSESTTINSFKINQEDKNGLPEDSNEVSTFIENHILLSYFTEIPLSGGIVVSIVKDDDIYLLEDTGMADNAENISMNASETLFCTDRISNVFTAAVVMQLVEKGLLDLNTDINSYLAAFKIPDTFKDPITLSHLLTHTAGFDGQETINTPISSDNLESLISLEEFLVDEIPERVRPPGEYSSYSFYGYALIGYIIEQITGENFEEYIEKNIFEQMEMNHSTFEQPIPSYLEPFMATNYQNNQTNYPFHYLIGPTLGSLYTTAADMAKFMIMQLNDGQYNGKTILSENSVDKLITDQFKWHPDIPGISYGMYNYRILNLTANGFIGFVDGYCSVLALIPKENIGIFIACNNRIASSIPYLLYNSILSKYYPYNYVNSTDANFEVHPNYKSRVGKYTGIYSSNCRDYSAATSNITQIEVTSDSNGYLIIDYPSFSELRFVEIEPMLFREASRQYDQARVAFKANENGLIEYMVLIWGVSYGGFDKLHPWYSRPETEKILLVLISILFLVSIVAYIFIALTGLTRGGKIDNFLITAARWYIVPLYLIIQLSIFSVNERMESKTVLIAATGTFIRYLTPLLILNVGFVIGGIILAVFAWTGIGNNKNAYWGRFFLIHYTILIATSLLIIWLLLNWMWII